MGVGNFEPGLRHQKVVGSGMVGNVAKSGERRSQDRLSRAVHRHERLSKEGLRERLFTLAFRGMVYPQIWEDPVVDMQAMAIEPGMHVVTIASGGCNVLSYLTADPGRITAVDLNRAHVALNKLKIAAARHLPDYQTFYRFFGEACSKSNLEAYETYIEPHLDEESRHYWQSRDLMGRRRIKFFTRNLYRYGLLGSFIGASHVVARLHGRNPKRMLDARTLEEQQQIYREHLAPLFAKRHIRWLVNSPITLYGLGIPPAQYKELIGDHDSMAEVLSARLEQLATGFALEENYFAWQAFGRRYPQGKQKALPPYLQEANYEAVRDRAERVEVHRISYTELLEAAPPASADRYVLLDAQDWMTPEMLTGLWTQITRTARPGARVIFRTAGTESILPGRLPDDLLGRWHYEAEQSAAFTRSDRSSVYGAFHLYKLA